MQPTRVLFGLALLTMTAAGACDKQSPDTAMPATPDTPAPAAADVADEAAPAVDVWAIATVGCHVVHGLENVETFGDLTEE